MLTPREMQVLTLRSDGLSNKEIARLLGIDHTTVGSHSKNLRHKLGAKDNAHAIAQAFRTGLLTAETEGTQP